MIISKTKGRLNHENKTETGPQGDSGHHSGHDHVHDDSRAGSGRPEIPLHEICCAQSTYSWLEVRQDGFYFGKYKTRDVTSGVVNVPEQLWRIRVIRDEGAYQVIRLSSMTKNGAAAAGWGEAIPHGWVDE